MLDTLSPSGGSLLRKEMAMPEVRTLLRSRDKVRPDLGAGSAVVKVQPVLEKAVVTRIMKTLKGNPHLVVRQRHGTAMGVSGDADHAPNPQSLAAFWLVAITVFLLGHAWFYKLRKWFADVL